MLPTFGLTILTFSLLLWNPGEALDKVRLDESGSFINNDGQVLMFHGFNWVVKSPPWYSKEMLNETKWSLLQKWGFNFVRLGVMWSGVMPREGQVDEKYMQTIENIIDICAKHKVYVLIDLHQDLLSSRFDGYDGIPLWLVEKLPAVTGFLEYPWPYHKPPTYWAMNYLTYACENCAQQLYTNVSGSWNHWADYWVTVASRFANKSNVIGYELINEPPPGNFYADPRRALPGYAGKHNLLPVYDYLVQRIRKVDQKTLIFYEPVTYSVFFENPFLRWETGFDRVPGSELDPKETFRSVLSYHHYCWLLQSQDPGEKMPYWKRLFCEDVILHNVFANSLKSIEKTGGGRFLTEFGVCGPDGNPESINTIECSSVMEAADKNLQSWAYWDGNFFDEEGNPLEIQLPFFSRSYPLATSGKQLKLRFDPVTGEFEYSFLANPKLLGRGGALAEIYLSIPWHYSKGVVVNVTPASFVAVQTNTRLVIQPPTKDFSQETEVKVSVGKVL